MGGSAAGAVRCYRHASMAVTQALADLTEISTQVEAAVVLDREGTVLASTLDDDRAGRIAGTALELVRAAEETRPEGAEPVVQLDVALGDGSVFVVSDPDRLIAATTAPEPTVGLVYYDLKNCLRGLAEEPEPKSSAAKPSRTTTRTRKKKDDESA
jgi:predicted regulator of Ras-like GTPase activity (Roadblock/LC7/MglB family)